MNNLKEIRIDPVTGGKLQRDVRPFTVHYKNLSKTVSLSGWYPVDDGEVIFTQEDLEAVRKILNK